MKENELMCLCVYICVCVLYTKTHVLTNIYV